MPELHSLINDVSDGFAEPDNSFQILEDYVLNFYAIHNVTFTDATGF